jgi:Immunoglobulin domain
MGLTLHFNRVRPSDRGLYFCVLCSNEQCTEGMRTDFNLHVDEHGDQEHRDEHGHKCIIDLNMDGPRDTRKQIGRTAYFYCYYNDNVLNLFHVTWWRVLTETGKIEELRSTDRTGVSIKFLNMIGFSNFCRHQTNQSLIIHNIQKEDAGLYTCQAKTTQGFAQAKTAELIVDDGWTERKGMITGILSTIALTTLILTLIIISAYAIKVSWYDRLKEKLKQWTKKVFTVTYIEENGVVRTLKINSKFLATTFLFTFRFLASACNSNQTGANSRCNHRQRL